MNRSSDALMYKPRYTRFLDVHYEIRNCFQLKCIRYVQSQVLFSNSNSTHRPKYTIREEKTSYKVSMWLTIRQFSKSDIGTYNCVSTNSLGKSEGTLRLYGKIFLYRKFWLIRTQTLRNWLCSAKNILFKITSHSYNEKWSRTIYVWYF